AFAAEIEHPRVGPIGSALVELSSVWTQQLPCQPPIMSDLMLLPYAVTLCCYRMLLACAVTKMRRVIPVCIHRNSALNGLLPELLPAESVERVRRYETIDVRL